MSKKKKTLYSVVALLCLIVFFWCAIPLLMGIIHTGMVIPMICSIALAIYCLVSLKYPMEEIPWKKDQDAAYKAKMEIARNYVRNEERSMRAPFIFGIKKEKLEEFDKDYEMTSKPGMIFSREARVKIDRVVWIITALAVVCLIVISLIMATGYEKFDGNYKGQTIVTLGAKINADKPSISLEKRLDKTVELMKEYPESKCIVTGGQGANEMMPESHVMATYLEEAGIDKSRIFEENKAENTEENLKFAGKVADENGLSKDFIIVTDGYHQYRANKNAEGVAESSVGSDVKTSAGIWLSSYFREIFAFFKTL